MNDNDRALLHKIAGQLEVLLHNHLPHIEKDIEDVKAKTWWIMGTVVVGSLLTIAFRFLS